MEEEDLQYCRKREREKEGKHHVLSFFLPKLSQKPNTGQEAPLGVHHGQERAHIMNSQTWTQSRLARVSLSVPFLEFERKHFETTRLTPVHGGLVAEFSHNLVFQVKSFIHK